MIELLKREVILSAQQIGTLDTIPVVIISASSPDKKVIPIFVSVEFLYDGFPMQSGNIFNPGVIQFRPEGSGVDYFNGINIFDSLSADSFGAAGGIFVSSNVPSSDLNGKSLTVSSYLPILGVNPGPIIDINPQSGTGSGYAIGDTGHVSQAGNTSATYVIDSVNGTGGVLTFHLSFGGNDYSAATGVSTTVLSGAGDGLFLADIISVGAGRLKIDIMYVEV